MFLKIKVVKHFSASYNEVATNWQQIGNRKSASQNNICNRNKITAKKDIKLKQIYLRISLDLPSLSSMKNCGKAHK